MKLFTFENMLAHFPHVYCILVNFYIVLFKYLEPNFSVAGCIQISTLSQNKCFRMEINSNINVQCVLLRQAIQF